MGAGGINFKGSEAGLNMMGVIKRENLEKKDFSDFNIKEVTELLKNHITDKLNYENSYCNTDEEKELYFSELFPERYADVVLLVAEYFVEYLENGGFVLWTFERFNKPRRRNIDVFTYTADDLKKLLSDLQGAIKTRKENAVQFKKADTKKWLAYVKEKYMIIENELKKIDS